MSTRIKPTLRKNGLMMFPMKIEFTCSRIDLINIGVMRALNENPLHNTRYEWIELLKKHLTEWGQSVTPDYLSDYPSDTNDLEEVQALVEGRISSLFPELTAKTK